MTLLYSHSSELRYDLLLTERECVTLLHGPRSAEMWRPSIYVCSEDVVLRFMALHVDLIHQSINFSGSPCWTQIAMFSQPWLTRPASLHHEKPHSWPMAPKDPGGLKAAQGPILLPPGPSQWQFQGKNDKQQVGSFYIHVYVYSIYIYIHIHIYIWGFPEMGVPPNHLF